MYEVLNFMEQWEVSDLYKLRYVHALSVTDIIFWVNYIHITYIDNIPYYNFLKTFIY